MDALQGCYRYQPRDCRYFAGFYLCVRILFLATFAFYGDNYTISGCYFIVLALVTFFVNPYRVHLYNKVDTLLFLFNAVICLLAGTSGSFKTTYYLAHILMAVLTMTLILYSIAVIAFRLPPRRLITAIKTHHSSWCSGDRQSSNGNLPDRLKEQENLPLL